MDESDLTMEVIKFGNPPLLLGLTKLDEQCMTRSSIKELFTPFENLKREFRSSRKLFKTTNLDKSSSLEFDLFSDLEAKFPREDVYKKQCRDSLAKEQPIWFNHNLGRSKGEISKQEGDLVFYRDWTRSNLGREIKKVNEKVYAAQVGCELCKGPHYTKDCPLKEEGKTLEEAYYTKFGVPFQQGGKYRALALDSYQGIMQTLQGFCHERGSGSLPSSTEMNPRDRANSISTTFETDMTSRLYDDCYDNEKGSYGMKDLDAYSVGTTLYNDALPQKQKDPGSFTLPCFNNVCFEKALADLGASISVMPLLTYLNLGLGELAHTKLTIELVDRTVKHPKGIAENVLVRIVYILQYCRFKMDDPNITMKEYIRLEEEKDRRHGKVYNWETVTYGKIWDNEEVHDLGSVETEFPAIVFNDTLTS
ncbi:hypothetical protein Tco_1533732 [Tanacetum coccineum]